MKIYFLKLLYQILFTKIDEEPITIGLSIDEPTLADAILDRILQHANLIELKGQSMRVRKNMQQNQV